MNKVLKLLLVGLLTVFMVSCVHHKRSKYPGFSASADSLLYYKMNKFGDGQTNPVMGDYLVVQMVYKTMNDSVFYNAPDHNALHEEIIHYQHPAFKGSYEEGFPRLHVGDSITYIVSADSVFDKILKQKLPLFLQPGSFIKVDIKLKKIYKPTAYKTMIDHYRQMVDNLDMTEQRKLNGYLETHPAKYIKLDSGLIYLPIKKGTGDKVAYGKKVFMSYNGTFLDGNSFDSTPDNAPFEYVFGSQGQVIKGLEKGISLMRAGGKAKFIIPSQLAFGAGGSSTGVVPPYTTVIYEVHVIKVE